MRTRIFHLLAAVLPACCLFFSSNASEPPKAGDKAPDFSLETLGLRWDAPNETAYPSTFVLDGKGIVRFAKLSKSHGGRTKTAEVLEEVKRLPKEES